MDATYFSLPNSYPLAIAPWLRVGLHVLTFFVLGFFCLADLCRAYVCDHSFCEFFCESTQTIWKLLFLTSSTNEASPCSKWWVAQKVTSGPCAENKRLAFWTPEWIVSITALSSMLRDQFPFLLHLLKEISLWYRQGVNVSLSIKNDLLFVAGSWVSAICYFTGNGKHLRQWCSVSFFTGTIMNGRSKGGILYFFCKNKIMSSGFLRNTREQSWINARVCSKNPTGTSDVCSSVGRMPSRQGALDSVPTTLQTTLSWFMPAIPALRKSG